MKVSIGKTKLKLINVQFPSLYFPYKLMIINSNMGNVSFLKHGTRHFLSATSQQTVSCHGYIYGCCCHFL